MILNTSDTNSGQCCNHSPCFAPWKLTKIKCDFQMFYHHVYVLNLGLKSWLYILLIF